MKTIIYIDPFLTDNNKLTEEIVNDLNTIVENNSSTLTELYLHSEKLDMDDKKLNIFLQKSKVTAFNFKLFKVPKIYESLEKNIKSYKKTQSVKYIESKNNILYQCLLEKPFKMSTFKRRQKSVLKPGKTAYFRYDNYPKYTFFWSNDKNSILEYFDDYLNNLHLNYHISTNVDTMNGRFIRHSIKLNFAVDHAIPYTQLNFLPSK